MSQKITIKEALMEIDDFNIEIALADNARELLSLLLALDFWTVQKSNARSYRK